MPDFGDVAVNNDNATVPLSDKGYVVTDAQGRISVGNGDNLTLQPGRYYFPAIGIGGQLTVVGPTELWIAGDVMVSGKGIINTTKNPEDLTLVSSGRNVNLGGQGVLYASVLAYTAIVKCQGNTDPGVS
jgi:hypothetical protein